jgi:hypothetical protein
VGGPRTSGQAARRGSGRSVGLLRRTGNRVIR